MLESFTRLQAERTFFFRDEPSGLYAVLVIDDTTLGPAAGGIRTCSYQSQDEMVSDAARLALAMTQKCALAGLPVGGGKMVVLDHPGLHRQEAFPRLGAYIEELRGLFRTAGDLGTRTEDLDALAQTTRYVHRESASLARNVALTVSECIQASVESMDRGPMNQMRALIQGCGLIGSHVAERLAELGVQLVVADIDVGRAQDLAERFGATVCDPTAILEEDGDILVPCAVGGVLTEAVARNLKTSIVCGGANNVLSHSEVADLLHERGIVMVPDILSSTGAVIDGIGDSVLGLEDRTGLIDDLGETMREVMDMSRRQGRALLHVAHDLARARIDAVARGA